MLKLAAERVAKSGYTIGNVDCIVFAQQPKLSAHKTDIAKRIATILDIKPEQVNVKAKTGEAVGPVGRNEAMMAECITLIMKDQT